MSGTSIIAKISMSLTRRCNLEANIFKSSQFCQTLLEGNFTITPECVTNPKLP